MTGGAAPAPVPLAASAARLVFDPDCGMIRELTFAEGGRDLRPMHRVPWAGEAMPEGSLPHLARMEGDFFCAPFATGGGSAPILHGWPANGRWSVQTVDTGALQAVLDVPVQGARLTKALHLRDGHPFLYQTHVFTGGSGAISVANHAMISLPEGGLVATSAKSGWQTPAEPQEKDPARGRSCLSYPAATTDPRRFPAADGGTVDLTVYPFRTRHEDFVIGTEAPGSPLGWTAVVRKGRGELYLSLRNPAVLPMTMLWHSEGGRDYAPWSGRQRNCLGVEEGNAPEMSGQPPALALGGRLRVAHAIGCIAWPSEAPVAGVVAWPDSLTVTAITGESRTVPFDPSHLAD